MTESDTSSNYATEQLIDRNNICRKHQTFWMFLEYYQLTESAKTMNHSRLKV